MTPHDRAVNRLVIAGRKLEAMQREVDVAQREFHEAAQALDLIEIGANAASEPAPAEKQT